MFLISSCNSVIGSKYDLGQFEVAENDFEETMVWGDANDACKKLGEGWRLPTLSELNIMYQNKDKIGHLLKVYVGDVAQVILVEETLMVWVFHITKDLMVENRVNYLIILHLE